MTEASLRTEKRGTWQWEGIVLAALFGFGLVLWPFLSFGAIFIFDSPIQNRSDSVHRHAVAYFIWFYPVTYAATCLAYYLLRRCRIWRLVSCFAWALPVVAYFALPAVLGRRGLDDTNAKRVQLLYRTDHNALLTACREIMANRTTFKQRKEDANRSFINPKDPKIPAAIAALRPRQIIADDDDVFLELNGGFDGFGVTAYSEKDAKNHTNALSGVFLLAPGLWFFDEELTYQGTDHAEYINKLKAMKPDDAPTPKW